MACGRQDGGFRYMTFHCDCTGCKKMWYTWFLVRHHFYWEEGVPGEVTHRIMEIATLVHDINEAAYKKELDGLLKMESGIYKTLDQLKQQQTAFQSLNLSLGRVAREFEQARLKDPTAEMFNMSHNDVMLLGDTFVKKRNELNGKFGRMAERKIELDGYLSTATCRFYLNHRGTQFCLYNMSLCHLTTTATTPITVLLLAAHQLSGINAISRSFPSLYSIIPWKTMSSPLDSGVMEKLVTWLVATLTPPLAARNLHKSLGCERELTFSIERGELWFTLTLPNTKEWTVRFYRYFAPTSRPYGPVYLIGGGGDRRDEWYIQLHNTVTLETQCLTRDIPPLLSHLIETGYGCGPSARFDRICWHCYDVPTPGGVHNVDDHGGARPKSLSEKCLYCTAVFCGRGCHRRHITLFHPAHQKISESSSSSSTSSSDYNPYDSDSFSYDSDGLGLD